MGAQRGDAGLGSLVTENEVPFLGTRGSLHSADRFPLARLIGNDEHISKRECSHHTKACFLSAVPQQARLGRNLMNGDQMKPNEMN